MSTDDGLTEAVQRFGVGDCEDFAANVQHLVNPLVGWLRLMQADGEALPAESMGDCIDRLAFVLTLAERETAVARAAREDVADLIRQARADELEHFAEHHIQAQTAGRIVEDMAARAAAIREGREP